jgi:tetratricopeptide (TPR) repeat protein
MAKTLFPHQKLEWNIKRLKEELESKGTDSSKQTLSDLAGAAERIAEGGPGDADDGKRLELARNLLSRSIFHGGGEQPAGEALHLCRKILAHDPQNVEALTLAGMALLGMNRPEGAQKHLDQAVDLDAERPDLRLCLGILERDKGDRGQAVRQLEFACRSAPDSWETNLFLGRALADLAKPQGNPRRLIERSQYHLIKALQLEPPPDVLSALLKDVGISCLLTGRYREAEKFFTRLREHETYAASARYFLGQVAYNLGKYHNAIQHYRQVLTNRSDDSKVLARMGMAWFQLGEHARAREACQQALLLDPQNLPARHALGCTLLEEGETAEALKVFRETLKDHPEHLPSYIEMVRTRRGGGDDAWLVQALQHEVGAYDRLPHGGSIDARAATRERIQVVLDELRPMGTMVVPSVLSAIDRTQDEGLRFLLWEAALQLAQTSAADTVSQKLKAPGEAYGIDLGIEALTVASALPDPVLTGGLVIEEDDLKRNAVNRHGPSSDVTKHRQRVDEERVQARGYQALLLLALATRRSASGKGILRKWAEKADPDLAVAAWTGLAIYGDADAAGQLVSRAATRGATPLVETLLGLVTPPRTVEIAAGPRDGTSTRCATCGRTQAEVDHLMVGGRTVVCDRCVLRISQHRRSLPAPDGAVCDLCGRGPFEVSGLYAYNGTHVCSACTERSLGLLEREEVERYLATC